MNKLFTKIASLTLGLALVASAGAFLGGRAVEGVKADSTFMTFDFEDSTAHRTSGNNSYSSTPNVYTENGASISLTYGDSVTTGSPLGGSANALLRIKKNETNTASMIIGPMDLSTYNLSAYSYKIKGVSTLTTKSSYSTDGASYTQVESYSTPSSVTAKGGSELSINEQSTVYLKFEVSITNGTSTTGNRDVQIDDIELIGSSTSSKPLESISCSDQEMKVADNLDLKSKITFTPNDAANKNVSFTIKNGSDYVDLTSAGVVTAKKGGSATITITPEDTSGGASAIDVIITTSSLVVPNVTIGDKYVIYANYKKDAIDANYEMSGLASSLGTATAFTGDIPSCSYVLDTEDGYFENTVAFKNGTKYLALTSAGNSINQQTEVNEYSSWIVEYDSSTNAAVIQNAVYQGRSIQLNYNNGSPRFACYGNASQTSISLYHYVEKALTDFTIDSSINVYKSGTATINVTYDPADASDKTLDWSSDDEAIAIVSNSGVVTGVAVGETTIRASKTINSVLVERTCTVSVLNNNSTHKGSEADPFDVLDAVQVANGVFTKDCDDVDIDLANEYYVTGQITRTVNKTKTTLTFWIGDDLSQTSAETGGFEIYKAGKVYGEALADRYATDNEVKADFEVEDYVTVKSILTTYKGTAETKEGAADIVYSSRAVKYTSAMADFAQLLLNYECKADYTEPSSTDWISLKNSFESDALSSDDREALQKAKAAEHETPSSDREKVEAAMAKYDYIIGKYNKAQGLTEEFPDFINRDPKSLKFVDTPILVENSKTSAIIVVTVIALTSVSAIAVLLVIKRRKTY